MTALAERWKEIREDCGFDSQNAFDEAIGKKGSKVSHKIESGKTVDPALGTVLAAARFANVRSAWLAFGEEPKTAQYDVKELAEMPAISFVSKLLALPNLIATVQRHPLKGWKLWQLASVVHDHLESPALATREGDPVRGTWSEVLDEKAGRTPRAHVVGGVQRARALHRQEHGATGRRKSK